MKNIIGLVALLCIATLQFSCKKILETNPPKGSLVQETVFQNNDQATSALTGIYATLANSGYASGDQSSITCFASSSADEFVAYNPDIIPFYENQITPQLSSLQNLYLGQYQAIYTANAVLEGLASTNGVTPPVKNQLRGEALFIRAFTYFYLVNLFGPIPLQLSTDYRTTQVATRAPQDQVYQQIINDLKEAEPLLSDAYVTSGRVRPNKSAVQAMLARTYLYLKDWVNAEKYASLIIAKSDQYKLVDIDAVFLANSQESIWQLMPPANSNTKEGNTFILTTIPLLVSLRNDFANGAFENADRRRASWVGDVTVNGQTYYYPFKYKVRSSSNVTEYSMVLRLAEQYLIRAEARINQAGEIGLGIEDLNSIRERARPASTLANPDPIPPLSLSLSKTDALLALEQERKVELFTEWGHRWLDLKRSGRANSVLSPIKSKWQLTDQLYPIPNDEITRNHNINQNDGY